MYRTASGDQLMFISVTEWDIWNGVRMECTTCPVALAIKRKLPDGVNVSVGRYTVHFSRNAPFALYGDRIPRNRARIMQFMTRFDRGLPVKPFTFMLMVPEKFLLPKVA